jgi:hypothetical protein
MDIRVGKNLFNRSWREYTGKSLAELCAAASD